MISLENLRDMQNIDILQFDKSKLVEISTVKIDTSKPLADRMSEYLHKIGNPYIFKVGETCVRVEYSSTDKTLDDAIKNYFIGLNNSL